MNLTDLKVAVKTILKTGRTPHLIGHAGTGKTSWSEKEIGADYDYVINLRVGQYSDTAELIGLPYTENGVMNYSRPWWAPREGKGLLILDEINRATKDIIQAIFQLVYDKQMGPHKFNNVDIIALSNPPTDSYIVLDFSDEAFQDRFVHIKFEPTVQELKEYLIKKYGKTSDMVTFLDYMPNLVTSKSSDDIDLNFVKPSNRSTDYFMTLEQQKLPSHIEKELAFGVLGLDATIAYYSYKEDQSRIKVTAEEVIENYPEAKKKLNKIKEVRGSETDIYDVHYTIIQGLLSFLKKQEEIGEAAHAVDIKKAYEERTGELTEEQHVNIEGYMLDLPDDLFVAFCTDALKYAPFYGTKTRELAEGLVYSANKRAAPLLELVDKAYAEGKTIEDVIPNAKLPQQEQEVAANEQ